jgi:predicted glycoside hydrolase/deacetylase ChbG (UPF0249 family)
VLLIVNADDLGASEAVNTETFSLMQAGLVTSATLMANGPAFEHAIKRIPDFPNCSFGVHLNLSEFHPLSDPMQLRPLLEDGELSGRIFHDKLSHNLRNALEQELVRQVQRVLAAGVPISHFDSHQFVHRLPRLFGTFKAVQRRFGICRVRTTSMLLPSVRVSTIRQCKRFIYRSAWRYIYATRSTDGWCAFSSFYTALHESAPLPRCESLDLMVHPGTGNPQFANEILLLRNDWQRLLAAGTRVVNYHAL